MGDHKSHLGSKHMLACLAIVLIAVVAVLAGAGSGVLLFVLLCPLMMIGMMWMMMGGMRRGGR